MLKKIRVFLAVIVFTFASLLFLDFTGTIHKWMGWIAKIQLVPSIFALNIGVLVALVIATLLFGRVYCSVICPMGMFQDLISWFARKRKKNKYRYSKAISWLRYTVLALFVISMAAGITSVVTVLEPYSSFGRITSNLFGPVYKWVNNILAYFSERYESYTFYSVDVWVKSIVTLIVSAATFVIVAILAWKKGRIYCNSVCPVGTFLGFLSKYSFFKPVINTDNCTNCGLCSRNCKSSCIDFKNHTIDYSRCVVCMDCIDVCNTHAIKYLPITKIKAKEINTQPAVSSDYVDQSRRKFISAISILALSTAFKPPKDLVDGGLAVIEDKKIPKRITILQVIVLLADFVFLFVQMRFCVLLKN